MFSSTKVGGALRTAEKYFSFHHTLARDITPRGFRNKLSISESKTFYSTKMASDCKCLTVSNMNPCIINMEYAVRGPLVIRATEIEKELQQVK
jgi:hypothetical protein